MSPVQTQHAQPLWYRRGLAFECQGCGTCCAGAPGYVWLSAAESRAIAQHLELSEDEFACRYLRQHAGRPCLRERPDYDCILLEPRTRSCTAYEQRPLQCRTWPWWRENLASPEAWAAAAEHCPGIGRGARHSARAIQTEMDAEWAANCKVEALS